MPTHDMFCTSKICNEIDHLIALEEFTRLHSWLSFTKFVVYFLLLRTFVIFPYRETIGALNDQ
jgi:hypothetical protein